MVKLCLFKNLTIRLRRITGILLEYTRYQYPDSQCFSACNGDLDCEYDAILFYPYQLTLMYNRHHTWVICHGEVLLGFNEFLLNTSQVGAAASLAGVTRTTVSLAVIMFE